MSRTPTCRSCGAPIRWARTEKGRRIPLDPEPVDTGNIVLDELDRALVYAPGAFMPPDEPRYRSHFATCPNAASHRRQNGTRTPA